MSFPLLTQALPHCTVIVPAGFGGRVSCGHGNAPMVPIQVENLIS